MSRRRKSRHHVRRPRSLRLEPLEVRQLLTVTTSFEQGQLVILGDATDKVTVTIVDSQVKINGLDPASGAIAATELERLEIHAGDQPETADVSSVGPWVAPNLKSIRNAAAPEVELAASAATIDQYAKALLQVETTEAWEQIVGHNAEEVASLLKTNQWKPALAESAVLDLFKGYTLGELQALVDSRFANAGLPAANLERLGLWDANGDFDESRLISDVDGDVDNEPGHVGSQARLVANGGLGSAPSTFLPTISRPGGRMLLAGSNPIPFGPILESAPEEVGGGQMSLMSTGGEGSIDFVPTFLSRDEGNGAFWYEIKLSADGYTDGGSIDWDFVSGSANKTTDFDNTSSTFSGDDIGWSDGAEGDGVGWAGPFYPIVDMATEGSEYFTVVLSDLQLLNPDGGEGPSDVGGPASGEVTEPDSVLPEISIANAYTVLEGGLSAFLVTRSGGSTATTTVAWSTDDGSATIANNDYAGASGSVVFAPGETQKWIFVQTNTDSVTPESSESFYVELAPSTSDYTLDDDIGEGIIVDVTTSTTKPEVTIANTAQFEGGIEQFTLTRSGNTTYATTVLYHTEDGTAEVVTGDYNPVTGGLVTFAPGQTTQTINIQTNVNVDIIDMDEYFVAKLDPSSDYTIDEDTGVGTIYELGFGDGGSTYDDCICYCVCGEGDVQDKKIGSTRTSVLATDDIAFDYNSATVSNYTMAVDWAMPAYSGSNPFERVKAEFKLGSLTTQTVWYNASSFAAGQTMHITMRTDASTLDTGTHDYSIKLTLIDSDTIYPDTARTFLGTTQVVNRGSSAFGQGWTLQGIDQLVTGDAVGITMIESSGAAYLFTPGSGGTYNRAAGQFANLTYASGVYTLTDPEGTEKRFNSSGQLTQVIDRNGNQTAYTYSMGGELITITNQLGYTTTLAYASGMLDSITDYAGRVTSIDYVGSTTKIEAITRPSRDSNPSDQIISFDYDGSSARITKIFKPMGDGIHANVQFHYGNDQKIYQVDHYDFAASTYRSTSLLSYQSAGLGYVGTTAGSSSTTPANLDSLTGFYGTFHDELSQPTAFVTDRFGGLTWTYSNAGETTYVTDSDGQVTDMYLPNPTTGTFNATTSPHYQYEYWTTSGGVATGQIKKVTYPTVGGVAATEQWEYGTKGQVSKYTDQAGRVTNYELDSRGNVNYIQQVVGTPNTLSSQGDDVFTTFTYTSSPTGTSQMPGGLVLTTQSPVDQGGPVITEYTYGTGTDLGLLTEVTYAKNSSDATTESYSYYQSGARKHLLESVTDDNDGVTTYDYDNLGRVTAVTLPKAKLTDSDSDRPKYVYHYNAIGAVDYVDAPPSNLAAVVTTGYERTTYKYNFLGQVTDVYLPDPDDGQSNWASSSSDSPHWHYDYDEAGRLIKTTDPRGAETKYAYDGANRLIGKTLADPSTGYADDPSPTSTATNSPRYKYSYDHNGNLAKVVNPLGAETRYHYDALGRLDGMTEANPALSGANSGKADNPDPAATPSDADSPRTKYEYYADNQLKMVTDPLSAQTKYHYDVLGRLDGMTLANPATTGTGAGLADDPDPASTATTSPRYKYSYDKNSNLIKTTDPMGHETAYLYDALDRQTDVYESDPTTGLINYGATIPYTGNARTHYDYDGVGNVVEVITPPNSGTSTQFNHTEYVYDSRNQLIEIHEPGTGGSATGPETSFDYDKAGNRIKLTDPNGNVSNFVFDALNRLKKDTNYNGTTGYDREYTYDKANNLTNLVDRNDRHTLYGYDKLNRQTYELWYATTSTTQQDQFLTYSYDLAGNLLSGVTYTYAGTSTPVSTKTIGEYFYYDKLGQAYNQFHLGPQSVPDSKLINSFDTAGNRTSTQTQFNSGSGYGTDNTIDRTFDKLSRLTSIKQTGSGFGGSGLSNKLVTVAYNKLSQVLDVHRYAASTASGSAEVAQTYNYYDGQNRVYIIQHKPSISGTAQTQTLLKYEYFADSSLKLESTNGLAANGSGSTWYLWDGKHEYAYDPRGQLTSDTHTPYTVSGSSSSAGTSVTTNYNFDDAGNRDTVVVGSTTTDYDDAGPNNELTDDGVFDYTYDEEGNITQKVRISTASADDKTVVYEWDNRNRLVKVTNKNNAGTTTQTVEYLYDAFDRRSIRTVTPYSGGSAQPATSEHYVYDGLSTNVLYTFSDADASATTNAPVLSKRYLTALDQIFAQENIGATLTADKVDWLLADRLGSTRVVLKNDGSLRQTIDYDPYGNATVRDASGTPQARSAAATSFQFTGQMFDSATGLQNNWHRWHDPATGRWMSTDPIGFDASDYNLHRYVANEPTHFTDPTGLAAAGQTATLPASLAAAIARSLSAAAKVSPAAYSQACRDAVTLVAVIYGMTEAGQFMSQVSGRCLDDILNNDEVFARWLKHKFPIDKPFSSGDAKKIYDKLKSLGKNPRVDPAHPGRKWDVPHINTDDGAHIPVEPGFEAPP